MGRAKKTSEPPLTELVEGTVSDIEKLLQQHLDLMRSEVKQELAEARDAAVSIGAGAGAAAVGGLLGTLMMVYLLRDTTRMPLWACYGIVGGLFGAVGGGLLTAGVRRASQIDLVPRQTAEVLKEELTGQPAHA